MNSLNVSIVLLVIKNITDLKKVRNCEFKNLDNIISEILKDNYSFVPTLVDAIALLLTFIQKKKLIIQSLDLKYF